MPADTRDIAAVVIGRNEGRRLVECLASVRAVMDRIVYVDSGSSDGSVARAGEAGCCTIALDVGPFTAARGRQAGLDLVERDFPGTRFVLFIDADCTLDGGFVDAALAHMAAHPRTGAVAGRRRESGSSFWSRVIDVEWDGPSGPVAHVGGDSLMRIVAIREAGGWPIDVIAGEEPDLCLRMRDRNWESHRIAAAMTLHDIRMTHLGQYWRRTVRAGHAYAEVAWRRRKGSSVDRIRAVASMVLYALVVPALILAGAVVYWPITILFGLLYVRLVTAVGLRTMRTGRPASTSFAYALLTVVGKFAGVVGMARYAVGLITGRRSRIIEYHGPTSTNTVATSVVPLGKSP